MTSWRSLRADSAASRSTCFSGASRPTNPTIGLPSGDHRPQPFVARRRCEAGDVDAARPLVYPRDAVRRQVFHRRGGRCQRAVGAAVQVPRPRPSRPGGEPDAVAFRETRDIGLEHGDRRHAEVARSVQPAVAEQRRRCQMDDVGVEPAQHADHPRTWHAQRQRGDLGEHPRRHPVDADTVMDLVGRRLTARGVRRNDDGLVTRAAEMLDHPKHRVGDAVDIREE